MRQQLKLFLLVLSFALAITPKALAKVPTFTLGERSVHALFSLTDPAIGPFPSNQFSVRDATQITGLRVNLPAPDCSMRPTDCEDIGVLNALDGFNIQPRLTVSFDGSIDVSSVNNSNFLLLQFAAEMPIRAIGINQIVWDPERQALFPESDELLDQHAKFALIVTNGIHDDLGSPVTASAEFRSFVNHGTGHYHRELLSGLRAAARHGIPMRSIVSASVFSTLSVTSFLEKVRAQLDSSSPEPADFLLGSQGERTVFALSDFTSILWHRQTSVNPPGFTSLTVATSKLDEYAPGAVSLVAFGRYTSPDYVVHPGEYVPPEHTLTGTPQPQGTNTIYFNLTIPSGTKPASGWPVAIIGHGGGSSKEEDIYYLAASLALEGIASLAINAPGRGGGPLGTLAVQRVSGTPITLPSGGRGFDQDGNGDIGPQEGAAALPPNTLKGQSDAQRQVVIDWMQLVRVIAVGVDYDGDGVPDLDANRISYFGGSFGGGLGPQLLAIEPQVNVGVFSYPGGAAGRIDLIRLRPATRGSFTGAALAARTPSLINPNGLTSIGGVPVGPPFFNENIPLRDLPAVSDDVPGAADIQELFDHSSWASERGDAAAYAPYVRANPLPDVPPKSVLIQIAKGDQTGPNPRSSAIIRAGSLEDITTYYRHDLAYAEDPTIPKNPHGFLLAFTFPGIFGQVARGGQTQMATFINSEGTHIIVPDPARFFEVPIVLPLPEDLAFIP